MKYIIAVIAFSTLVLLIVAANNKEKVERQRVFHELNAERDCKSRGSNGIIYDNNSFDYECVSY